jgi:hypothetical protein
MQAIHAIQFEGGPEDGRILSAGILRHVFDQDREQVDTDIRIFLRPEGGEDSPDEPVLLGRYVRADVTDGKAVYRWDSSVD